MLFWKIVKNHIAATFVNVELYRLRCFFMCRHFFSVFKTQNKKAKYITLTERAEAGE